MLDPYSDQLIILQEWLDSPQHQIVQDAYDELFKLWETYFTDPNFNYVLKEIAKTHPSLVREFTDRVDRSIPISEQKIMYLEKIELLKLSDVSVSVEYPQAESKKESKWSVQRIAAIIICGAFIVLAMGIYLKYVNPQNPPRIHHISSDLVLTYTSPKYISEEDHNSIEIALINQSISQTYNGVITLTFSDRDVPVMPVPGKNLSMTVTNLGPRDRITEQLVFTLPGASSRHKVFYYLRVSLWNPSQLYLTPEDEFLVSPFPRIWAILVSLFSAGGLGSLAVTFLWEQLISIMKLISKKGENKATTSAEE